MKKIAAFFLNRWFLGTIGILLFSFVIWVGGPFLRFGRFAPLDSAVERLIIILGVLLFIAAKLLWKYFKDRHHIESIARVFQQLAEKPAPNASVDNEREKIRETFRKAVTQLKNFRGDDKSSKSPFAHLYRLASRQYLRRWPWYLIIGAPGSGKTFALRYSGLKYALTDQAGFEVSGPEPTRYMDWMFMERAVFVDTAGRFTTQDSNADVDRSGWESLLHLFKKHRPINGLLVTVSVLELLGEEGKLKAVSDAIARRIQDLYVQLGARLPVYVIVTKCDLLAGFMDFFRTFDKDQRSQVWGFTLPLSATESNAFDANMTRAEIQQLMGRLNSRVINHMQQEVNLRSRELLFAFPQQIARLTEPLVSFLDKTFSSLILTDKPLFRGVYLTSATQENSPIDRVLGRLAKVVNLSTTNTLPAQKPSGRSYFITHVLERVIFPEADLRNYSLRRHRYGAWGTRAAFVLLPIASLGVIIAWLQSKHANEEYVQQVSAKVAPLQELIQAEITNLTAAPWDTMSTLQAARHLSNSDTINADIPPVTVRLGLFQGSKLQDASGSLYRNLLQTLFLPRLANRVAADLRASISDPTAVYEPLKVYLMLHDAGRFNRDDLKNWLKKTWNKQASEMRTQEQLDQLLQQVDEMKREGIVQTPTVANNELIGAARSDLKKMKLPDRVYRGLLAQVASKVAHGFNVSRTVGDDNAFLFVHANQQAFTDDVVASTFTREGYESFLEYLETISETTLEEFSWLLGEPNSAGSKLSPDAIVSLRSRVLKLYLEDYAKAWQDFLADVRIKPALELAESSKIAAKLADKNSALRLLFIKVVDHTTLVKSDPTVSGIATLPKAIGNVLDRAQAAAGEADIDPRSKERLAESIVDDRFAALRRYVTGEEKGQPAPIDATIEQMVKVQQYFSQADEAIKKGMTPPASDVPNSFRNHLEQSVPDSIKLMLRGLIVGGSRQADVAARKAAGGKLHAEMGSFCNKIVDGYPFNRKSSTDVRLENFGQLFGAAPAGKLDDFFQKNLVSMVDTTKNPWRFQTSEGSVASGGLVQFQRAKVIRETFVPNGKFEISLDVQPGDVDAAIKQFTLNIDGTLILAQHGQSPPVKVTWPGPKGGTQVELQISPPSAQGGSEAFHGPWALFRALDKAKIEPLPSGDGFYARFNVGGHWAEFKFMTGIRNPFRLRELASFRCPSSF